MSPTQAVSIDEGPATESNWSGCSSANMGVGAERRLVLVVLVLEEPFVFDAGMFVVVEARAVWDELEAREFKLVDDRDEETGPVRAFLLGADVEGSSHMRSTSSDHCDGCEMKAE